MPVLIRLNALVGTVTDDYIAQEGEVLRPLPEGFDLDNWEYAEGALRKKPVRLTRLDYMRRFTLVEEAGIRVEARTDPMIEVILGRLSAAEYVDVTDTETVAGVDYLVGKGLLTAERKAEVLA